MDKYNPDATCPECNCAELVSTPSTWQPKNEGVNGPLCDSACPDGEHMHRTCRWCGEEWIEAPLDAEEHKCPT